MKKHIALTLAVVALAACATQAGQEQLAASIQQTRQEAGATASQLQSTLAALNKLVGQTKGDLAPAYEAFRAEIPKTQNAATITKVRLETMTSQKDKYFREWQDTIRSINNPSLQKKAQKRLDSSAKLYDSVEGSLKKAGEKFRPFLSDLADIEKSLSQDVTAHGVKNVKSVVRSANWNYQFLDKTMKAALKDLEKMEKALSSQAS